MIKQAEIYENLRSRIPADLWEKYSHLSFGEMARVDELQPWAFELEMANAHWFDSDGPVGTT